MRFVLRFAALIAGILIVLNLWATLRQARFVQLERADTHWLQHWRTHITDVRLERRMTGRDSACKYQVLFLSEIKPDDAVFVDQFRQIGSFHASPTSPSFDCALLAIAGSDFQNQRVLKYSTRTGELGSGSEWCFVCPGLRYAVAERMNGAGVIPAAGCHS